jgi:hypothetical protein
MSTVPPRNTFAGLGPDDQVLVPIELVEVSGTPTAREIAVVQADSDDAATAPLERIELEPDTEPIEKLVPANGAGSHVEPTEALHQEEEAPIVLPKLEPIAPPPPPIELRAPVPQLPFVPPPPPVTPPAPVTPPPFVVTPPAVEPVRSVEPSSQFVPPPLELPPLPTKNWRLVVGISLGVALLASLVLYFTAQHEASPPRSTPAPSSVATKPPPPPPTEVAPAPVAPAPVASAQVAPAPVATAPVAPAPVAPKPVAPAPAPEPVKQAEVVKPPAPEPPKPTATGIGALDLSSSPPGAHVWIDQAPRGQTPLHIELPVGNHNLLVFAEGAQMHRETLRVASGAMQLDVQLPAAALTAGLSGNSGLKVRCKTLGELRILVDGVDTGKSCPNEQRISVAPGPHKIGLYSPRADKTYEIEKELPDDDRVSTRVYTTY